MAEPLPLHRCGSEKPAPSILEASRRRWYEALKAEPGTTKYMIKNHFIAMVGEFVGTTLFLIFALGGADVASRASTSVSGGTVRADSMGADAAVESVAQVVNTSNLLYISLSFGLSLAVNVWIFFRISGGLFNPAVSLGMWLIGALEPLRAVLLVVSQIAGGIAGSAIVYALLPGTFNVQTTLSSNTSIVRGVFIEMFLTTMLLMAIFLLAAEKSRSTFIAPIGIGLALFIAEMLGVAFTGGSLNPARSIGPSVVTGSFVSYHWIYWVGPGLGAAIAAGFYRFIKFLEYETCLGPDCDGDGSCAISAPLQPPPTSLMMSTALSARSHAHSHHHQAPRMGLGMSTTSEFHGHGNGGGTTMLSVPRTRAGSKLGNEMSRYHSHESTTKTLGGGNVDASNGSTVSLGTGVEKEQLDRIEVMLSQLLANGKIV